MDIGTEPRMWAARSGQGRLEESFPQRGQRAAKALIVLNGGHEVGVSASYVRA